MTDVYGFRPKQGAWQSMKVARYRVFGLHRKNDHVWMSLSNVRISATEAFTQFGCYELEDFLEDLRAERSFTSRVIEGADVLFENLGAARIGKITEWSVESAELAKEMMDAVRFLRGELTSSDECLAALRAHLRAKCSAETLPALEASYLRVPAHCRPFLLAHMDYKDHPIRALIEARVRPDDLDALRPGGELGHIWNEGNRPVRHLERRIEEWDDPR